ncbi:hypothetical protein [Streptomyces sp. 5-10]|uniref:hypothetical protein n=1 Tax=Streptomyces sp. 5-10 TaxID=878925 RepID=UPI001CC2C3C4|nr:hypothetical protein [Streptomyces sp. 5-10]
MPEPARPRSALRNAADRPVERHTAAGVLRGPGLPLEGAEEAGDPIAVLPVLVHLMWRQEPLTDLSVLLSDRMVVRLAVEDRR